MVTIVAEPFVEVCPGYEPFVRNSEGAIVRKKTASILLAGTLSLFGVACEDNGDDVEDVTPELDSGEGEEGVVNQGDGDVPPEE